MNLFNIEPGQQAIVESIQTEGAMGRRLMDLGLTEGTRVVCVGRSPGGDPAAFLIRGAVIAIRSEDCAGVRVRRWEHRGE